jgi:hypothetical protein
MPLSEQKHDAPTARSAVSSWLIRAFQQDILENLHYVERKYA